MRVPVRSSAFVLFLLLSAASAFAGGFRKAYFAATVPGAFARTRSVNTVNGDVSEYVYARLADEGGKVSLETRYELKTGAYAGTKGTNSYVLTAGFPFGTAGPGWMRGIEKSRASGPDGTSYDMDEATVRAIAAGATDYGAIVVFEGAETVDGKACDRYGYSFGEGTARVEGKYWLSEKVPFAVVKEVTSGTDATGARYRFETKLVESGVKPELARRAPKAAPPARTLGELYADGKLSILVEVMPGAARARLTLTNTGEEPLALVVPKGTTTLACGDPVGGLVLDGEAERMVAVPAGASGTPFEMTMRGGRRPREGSFTITVYEGAPLLSGRVVIDTAKE